MHNSIASVNTIETPVRPTRLTAPGSLRRGQTGSDFAVCLPAEGTRAAAAGAPVEAAGLLLVQAEAGEPQPRRRRSAREAAARGLTALGLLQRAMLDGGKTSPAALVEAAEEAETLGAAEGGEAERLCRAVALRLRLEVAKLEGNDPGRDREGTVGAHREAVTDVKKLAQFVMHST